MPNGPRANDAMNSHHPLTSHTALPAVPGTLAASWQYLEAEHGLQPLSNSPSDRNLQHQRQRMQLIDVCLSTVPCLKRVTDSATATRPSRKEPLHEHPPAV
ncbi:hypothetical protein GCM10027416_16890 [Okibacterium endophyticum]